MAKIALSGLCRNHPGSTTPALSGLDLEVGDGELLVLVGPSGCGKSTTLRLISGLDTPDAGTIHIDGRDVTAVAPQDRDVAMVFQGYALYPHMRVREILAFPLKMRGVSKAEQEKKVLEAAEMLGLSALLHRRPLELSGGERQRVAMGRAIVRSPKVFLFDEPLSNLDAALRAELRVELSSLVRRLGVTSVYVTHDQVEAMTLGDRIAVMKAGFLQQVGTPKAIYEAPSNLFVASFLGTPTINQLSVEPQAGKLVGKGFSIPLSDSLANQAWPRSVVVGVRPERVRLHGKEPQPNEFVVEAEVIHNEPLGAETYVYLDAEGTKIAARVAGWDVFAKGDKTRVIVAVEHCLFFDAATKKRIEVGQ